MFGIMNTVKLLNLRRGRMKIILGSAESVSTDLKLASISIEFIVHTDVQNNYYCMPLSNVAFYV